MNQQTHNLEGGGSCPCLKSTTLLNSSYCPLNSPLTYKIFLGFSSIQFSIPAFYSPSTLGGPFPRCYKIWPSLFSQCLFQSPSSYFLENLFLCFSSYILPSFKSLFQGNLTSSYTGKPTGMGVKTRILTLGFHCLARQGFPKQLGEWLSFNNVTFSDTFSNK